MPDNLNIIRNFIRILAFLLLFSSCNDKKQSVYDEMPPLYPAPQSVPLNIEEGYITNQVTGDSIQPIINSLGDTVKSGIPIPAIGRVIDPSLTTVHYPGEEMGEVAASSLIEMINKTGPVITKTVVLEHKLIIRKSSIRK